MFKKRKSFFMKNMAFLVCLAFIFMAFPEATQAATRSSSQRFSLPRESTHLISAIFSFACLNLSPAGYDLAFFYTLSNNMPKLPHEAKNGLGSKNAKIPNGNFNTNGNSTSTKTPDDQD